MEEVVDGRFGGTFVFDAHEEVINFNADEDVQFAAGEGNLRELRRLHENGHQLCAEACAFAAEVGHLDCLRFLHENECPWDERTCTFAAKRGELECLKFAHENGCPWDEETCARAAYEGYLECLRYAHENRCPWDERVLRYACERNRGAVVRYALANGLSIKGHLHGQIQDIIRDLESIHVAELHREAYETTLTLLNDLRKRSDVDASREFAHRGYHAYRVHANELRVVVRESLRQIMEAIDTFNESIPNGKYVSITEKMKLMFDGR